MLLMIVLGALDILDFATNHEVVCVDAYQAQMDDFKIAVAPLTRVQISDALQLITCIIDTMEAAASNYNVDFGTVNPLPTSRGFYDLLARRNELLTRFHSTPLGLTNGF